MASVNLQKRTLTQATGLSVHLEQHLRERCNHSNEDIQKELTKENYALFTESYKESLERLKARVKEVDAVKPPQRVKKDRVVCISYYLPCPDIIRQNGQADAFFESMYHALESYVGAENLMGAFIHKDEVHDYIDTKTKEVRTSLEHMHIVGVPYTEEKGINGKAFMTKGFLEKIQQFLNTECLKEFGVPLLTGEEPRHQSVEKLKLESAKAELEQVTASLEEAKKAERRAIAGRDEANRAKLFATHALEALEKKLEAAQKQYEPYVEAKTRLQEDFKRLQKLIESPELFEERYRQEHPCYAAEGSLARVQWEAAKEKAWKSYYKGLLGEYGAVAREAKRLEEELR